ncbi:LPD7 domain-containing protein [Methylovorus glucosotrophus]|uniref:Uncharacterized protein n=1 Tax=Methylovorus glucosotrophus (strain SIP3-4) TaxID=582744 RepID=C6XEQ3_METGS|nr:LPD7 domain-containing protein [Methylovorus glucosotrophus]ACT52110.1 hypothetical protein Msip34_2886 [Methylovorus glucosotrophus SIP3-4]
MQEIEEDIITPVAIQSVEIDQKQPGWNPQHEEAIAVINSFNSDVYLKDMMKDESIIDPRLNEAFETLFPGKLARDYAQFQIGSLPIGIGTEPVIEIEDSITPVSLVPSKNEDGHYPDKRKLLNGLFVERENNQFFRLDAKKPALLDDGQKLRIVNKDLETFQAAIELAHAKGWTAIQVKGSERFRAEAWYQASLKGLQIEGYVPTEKDLIRLSEQRLIPQMNNEDRQTFKASLQSAEDFALERDAGIVYPDSVNENRRFSGKVVKILDSHVIQDIGRNTFAVHEKAKVGNQELGLRLDIKYKGRGAEIQTPSKDRSNSITR